MFNIDLNPHLLNGSNLSYLGDAFYELYIRVYLIGQGITKGKKLQELASKYVSAHAHHLIMNQLKNELTDEEMVIYKKGRNIKLKSHRKNLNLQEYSTSSGFEALIGYWYANKNIERMTMMMDRAIAIINQGETMNVNIR